MNFTNENPCNFYYVKADENFAFDVRTWKTKALPERNSSIAKLHEVQNDPDHVMYNIPVKMTLEEFEKERATYEWYNTTYWNDDGSPIEVPVPELSERVKTNSGFVAPNVFEEIQKVHSSGINRFAISYIGKLTEYQLHPHFHPHIRNQNGSSNRECHTLVVVVPLTRNSTVKEIVYFNHQDHADEHEESIMNLCRETASPYNTVRGKVTSVLMPASGQYLVLEFNGTRCLHWLENYGTENEYLCLVSEN